MSVKMPVITKRDILKICYLYYRENKSQEEIATVMGLNRIKISRLLKEGRDKGLVSVVIADPLGPLTEMEVNLAKQFGLREAVVVRLNKLSAKSPAEQIGEAGAQYVSRIIRNYNVLSIAWGSSLRLVIENMAEIGDRNLTVVQLSGGTGGREHSDVNILTVLLSQKVKGKPYFVQAPMIVSSKEARDAFLKESRIAEALSIAVKSEIALLGIGPISKEGRLWKAGLMNHSDYRALRKAKAVGAICGRCFDQEGKPCLTDWDNRVIGLTLDQIKGIKNKVGVAFGLEKTNCIAGALKGHLIDILITDEDTAKGLLAKS